MLSPFWSYYGSKWRIAGLYPRPQHQTLVEPFAGSACYALRYPHHQVLLCDQDEIVCGIWDYLIKVSEAELLALPDVVQCVDDVVGPQEARWLIGFWMGRGLSAPCRQAGRWMKNYAPRKGYGISFWGSRAKARIAAQLRHIRHWQIRHGSYSDLGVSKSATWFIDPPYRGHPGRRYRKGSTAIDYVALALWCRSLPGQVIVCEALGANWMPFEPLSVTRGMRGNQSEAVWLNHGGMPQLRLPYVLTEP